MAAGPWEWGEAVGPPHGCNSALLQLCPGLCPSAGKRATQPPFLDLECGIYSCGVCFCHFYIQISTVPGVSCILTQACSGRGVSAGVAIALELGKPPRAPCIFLRKELRSSCQQAPHTGVDPHPSSLAEAQPCHPYNGGGRGEAEAADGMLVRTRPWGAAPASSHAVPGVSGTAGGHPSPETWPGVTSSMDPSLAAPSGADRLTA